MSEYGTAAERAARGAKELDKQKPAWPTLMKLETFHGNFHYNAHGCVLDRVYGRWTHAPYPFSEGGYIKYGMNVTMTNREQDGLDLMAAWHEETNKRLAVLNV